MPGEVGSISADNGVPATTARPRSPSRHDVASNESATTTVQNQEEAKRDLESRFRERRELWTQCRSVKAILGRPSGVVLRKLESFGRAVKQKAWSKRADRIKDHKANLGNAAAGFILKHERGTADDWRKNVMHYLGQLRAEECGADTEEGRAHLDDAAKEVALKIREQQGDWDGVSTLIDRAQGEIGRSNDDLQTKLAALKFLQRVSIRCRQEEMKEDLRTLYKWCKPSQFEAWRTSIGSKRYATLASADSARAKDELLEEGWNCFLSSRDQFRVTGDLGRAATIWSRQGANQEGWRGTCGMCSVAFLAQLFGKNVSEKNVAEEAFKTGLHTEYGGTTTRQQLALLKRHGVDAKRELVRLDADWNAVSNRLAELVEGNRGVTCGVNSGIFWNNPQKYFNGNINHRITLVGAVRSRADGQVLGFHVLDSAQHEGNCRFVPTGWLREAILVPGGDFIYTRSSYSDAPRTGTEGKGR